ncbi:hypothetical protein C922_05074 [Plasmodium inui San Antonio 1]|uniref:Uncharacterized protein n=1 Tax=Plasmodium inui San Antonio 1 TaxID=1237626 RepID=W6ZZ27_9APIC|nr:hypothetical protein C922_05074 [Plasmodium inui San Antonio 1]EUD64558.1 hypothetical protein C922_05074 [Plasmodium inui San Antonio 1]
MSLNLCNWRNHTWLGSTVEGIEAVCKPYAEESGKEDRKENPKESLWVGWLDEYLKGENESQLGRQYLSISKEEPVGKCGTRTKSLNISTWEKLVTDVLDKIENMKKLKYASPHHTKKGNDLAYDELPDWRSILCRRIWPESTQSGATLAAIACIIARLAHPGEHNEEQWTDPTNPCRPLLRQLQVTESEWAKWLSDDPGDTPPDEQHGQLQETAREQAKAKISLVLNLYGALKELCPKCGPYHLRHWITVENKNFLPQENLYCLLTEGHLKCNSELGESITDPNYLLYRATRVRSQSNFKQQGDSDTKEKSPEKEKRGQAQGGSIPTRSNTTISTTDTNKSSPASSAASIPKNQGTPENTTAATENEETDDHSRADSRGLMGMTSGFSPPPVGAPKEDLNSEVITGPIMTPTTQKGLPPPVSQTKDTDEQPQERITHEVSNGSPGVIGGVITAIILGGLSIYGGWRIKYARTPEPHTRPSRISILVKYPSSGNTLDDGSRRRDEKEGTWS